jgi:hypothetical protein
MATSLNTLAAAGVTARPGRAGRRRGPAGDRPAKAGETGARHLRMLLAGGRLPQWRSRPPGSWRPGRCWSWTTTCAAGAPPGRSGSTRCCSTRAPRCWAGALCTGPGVAALRAAAAAHRPAAGQRQAATALEVTEALQARPPLVRHQLAAARHRAGAKALAARLYGVGPVTALAITCWLAGAGRFSFSRQAVRFAGPGHHRVLLRPHGPAREAVPAGAAGAALGRRRGRQDPTPAPPPRPPVLRRGQGPHQHQARLPARGPQDPPARPITSRPGPATTRSPPPDPPATVTST